MFNNCLNVYNIWEVSDIKKSKFYKSKVLFVDLDDSPQKDYDLITKSTTWNNKIQKVNYKGETFEVLGLTGDGGFNSIVIMQKDVDRFMKVFPKIEFIEK